LEDFHLIFHGLELLGEGKLLLGLHGDLFDGFNILEEFELFNIADLDVFSLERSVLESFAVSYNFLDFLPVLIVDGLGSEASDQRKILCEHVNDSSKLLSYLRSFWEVLVKLLVELEARILPHSY
jgi:hypothetical protein